MRFPLLTEHFLVTEIKKCEYMRGCQMCGVLVQEAAQLKTQSFIEGSGSGALRLNIPQYRGCNQLLLLQCSNTYY